MGKEKLLGNLGDDNRIRNEFLTTNEFPMKGI